MHVEEFRDRYALRTFPEGGIIVDLETGAYSRTNRSATAICAAILKNGSSPEVQIAAELRTDVETAKGLVRQVIDGLAAEGPRRVRPDPFIYALAPDSRGYLLLANGAPKLSITRDGQVVSAAVPPVLDETHLYDYLRALAPRLAFLRGRSVIHGAACVLPSTTIAICGDSGAGKTTTARSFRTAGGRVIAEDMLVVDSTSPLSVKVGGEAAIQEWAADTAQRLRQNGRSDTAALEAAWDGDSTAVQQLWFIAAEERLPHEERIVHDQLEPIDATLTAMASLFLGGTSPDQWRRFLDLSAAIAESVLVFHTRVPSGVEPLARAAAAYIRSSASYAVAGASDDSHA